MTSRFLLGLAASLLLLATGCKDPGSNTAGSALYAFDSTTSQVFVWNDMEKLYGSPTSAPDLQISSSLFSQVTNLAWGGLCFDQNRGVLYLVSATGSIVRVSAIRTQTAAVPSTQVFSFSLSSTGRLTNSSFGQATLDAQTDTLYITENGDSATQIWVVSGASTQTQNASVALQALQIGGDTGGTGVAAANGAVYGFMANGGPVGINYLTGPRIRKGVASGFDPNSNLTIVGSQSLLGIYGSLAFDTGDGLLFAARHNTDSGTTAPPIDVFTTGQFTSGPYQTPNAQLGSATNQPNLRVISHPGIKDWLVGLSGTGTTGSNTIFLWKSPSGGTDAVAVTAPAGSVLKGLAVDGNAS
ncbi:MAG: hypothetical protein P4L11_04870 [Geothrix sp.]|nr:hypothetical protein [Geothrix sp.]